MGDTNSETLDLLHPFYLDTDMSMAFAAALTGGVALQTEEVEHEKQESEALRNLRGNLRIFDMIGLGGGRESKEGEAGSTESRLRREHTKASIFIGLYDELQQTGRVHEENPDGLETGQLISLTIGPAVAPLRRIVDQILRLLDVLVPFTGAEPATGQEDQKLTRQQRRQQAREAAKAAQESSPDAAGLAWMRQIFIALQDDLERSGMLDVVVQRDDAPNVILTLDERFISDQVLELLHTSRFTVIGKVTQVWSGEEEFVNLYRRSVVSLVPALAQSVSMGMWRFLIGLAEGAQDGDPLTESQSTAMSDDRDQVSEQQPEREDAGEGDEDPQETDAPDPEADDVVISQEAFQAVIPVVASPAFQLLPLAICA